MASSRNRTVVLTLALVFAALAGFAAWLLYGGLESGRVEAPDVSRKAGNQEGTNRADDDAKPGAANRASENTESPDPPANSGDSDEEKYRLPDGLAEPSWNPEDFANTRLPWRLPVARPDAQRPEFTKKYNGTPMFLGYAGAFRIMPELYGDGGFFDPAQPDGILVITAHFLPNDASLEWRKDCVAEATSHDGAFVYRYPEYQNGISFAVPYSYHRTETVGLRITGPNMLPVEAIIGQVGPGELREKILTEGEVRPSFRVFPADYNDFREILVTDGEGNPVKDAMLTYNGVQIFGRSDASGRLRFPWPAARDYVPERDRIREKYFFLSAPGYVPVLFERSQLEKANALTNVTLKARELLVSVYETVPDPDVLRLGIIPGSNSSVILHGNIDLIPLQDDYPVIEDWNDFHRALFGKNGHWYDRQREQGELAEFPGFHTGGTGPYEPDHEFGDESARKLAEALGRRPTEHWPLYARWYYGRWDYIEREGRFDVVLPFAGRFMLAVGEYNRGPKNYEHNGKLTHVLYIDARDPTNVKSKLLIHPLG